MTRPFRNLFAPENNALSSIRLLRWPETGMWEITHGKSASIRQSHWHRHLAVNNALVAEVDSGGCREVGFEEVWNIIRSPVRRA